MIGADLTGPIRDPEDWGRETWRAPQHPEGAEVLFELPGRIVGRVCHRSHYFRVFRNRFGSRELWVRHGGGTEQILLSITRIDWLSTHLASIVDDDDRYLLVRNLYEMIGDARRRSESATALEYRQAFADGRLKKRKARGGVKVWIEPAMVQL